LQRQRPLQQQLKRHDLCLLLLLLLVLVASLLLLLLVVGRYLVHCCLQAVYGGACP
jgi:hypothetical protein